MPELPEVETARRRAERALRGRRIAAVAVVRDPIVYDGVSPSRFAAALRGRRVEAVRRKGKHLWMELDRRPWPLFHFGMTGSFEIYRDGAPRPRFWKVEIAMEDGTRLAMPDPRRFGRIRLQESPQDVHPLASLRLRSPRGAAARPGARDAPRPARGAGEVGAARPVAVRRRRELDRRRGALPGGDRPPPPGVRARPGRGRRLRARLLAIVRRAVAVGADDRRFPRGWLFHDRWGREEGARTARGERIVHLTIGGRTTAFVPARQR